MGDALYYPSMNPSSAWLRSALLFYDKIRTIVPENYDNDEFYENRCLSDALNGALERIPSDLIRGADIDVDFNRLMAGLLANRKKNEVSKRKINFSFQRDGSRSISGYEFVHLEKITPRVMDTLRQSGCLAPSFANDIINNGRNGDFLAIERDAAQLLMSLLADRIAMGNNWQAVTDQERHFAFLAINNRELVGSEQRQDALGSLMVKALVPKDISKLSLLEVTELRKRYEDIRAGFMVLLDSIERDFVSGRCRDEKVLRERLELAVQEVNKQVNNIQASRIGSTILRWSPFTMACAVPIAATAVSNATYSVGSVQFPIVAAAGAALVGCLNIIDRVTFRPEAPRERIIRRIAQLKDEVKSAVAIKREFKKITRYY